MKKTQKNFKKPGPIINLPDVDVALFLKAQLWFKLMAFAMVALTTGYVSSLDIVIRITLIIVLAMLDAEARHDEFTTRRGKTPRITSTVSFLYKVVWGFVWYRTDKNVNRAEPTIGAVYFITLVVVMVMKLVEVLTI